MKIKPRIGTNDVKLTLTNGILTSYGLTTDTKIPETITAVTGLLTGLSSTVTSFKAGENTSTKNLIKEKQPDFELYEIIIEKDNPTILRKVKIDNSYKGQ
jgi:hypothetical protein